MIMQRSGVMHMNYVFYNRQYLVAMFVLANILTLYTLWYVLAGESLTF